MKVVVEKGENNMFANGDRVVVKDNKADPTRLKVGTTGTLCMINEHFVVVKIDGLGGLNLMFAPAEFFLTFEKYKEKTVREWTKWEVADGLCCEFLDARSLEIDCTINILTRQNGKRVQVRALHNGITAEASCHNDDEFDFDTGVDIALARLSVKMTEYTLREKIRNME